MGHRHRLERVLEGVTVPEGACPAGLRTTSVRPTVRTAVPRSSTIKELLRHAH
ncbi:predicted protein [Streptomyces filamentosus NRRL 15998]|uniref:Predicted protein n=1 Tax=Streptomyces filamentosus NRRL 15998 TaxID=457431 RepID=D6ATL4_STRFL|nr:predicted protein [Streptomyces filamentosus NRRL 15998]